MESEQICSRVTPVCIFNSTPSGRALTAVTGFNGYHCAKAGAVKAKASAELSPKERKVARRLRCMARLPEYLHLFYAGPRNEAARLDTTAPSRSRLRPETETRPPGSGCIGVRPALAAKSGAGA